MRCLASMVITLIPWAGTVAFSTLPFMAGLFTVSIFTSACEMTSFAFAFPANSNSDSGTSKLNAVSAGL